MKKHTFNTSINTTIPASYSPFSTSHSLFPNSYFLFPNSYFLVPVSILLLSLVLFSGCRREDIREMTVSMPGLTEADKAKVVESLKKYNGIDKDSYVWDMNARTLTLRYDSMQIAQANIRYAIDEKGVKVAFPEKTDDRAGH